MDKICFIGQSATGKTTMLELIKENYHSYINVVVNSTNFAIDDASKISNSKTTYFDNGDFTTLSKDIFEFKDHELSFRQEGGFSNFTNSENRKLLFYLKANLISDKNIEVFTKNPLDLFEQHHKLNSGKLSSLKAITPITFDDEVNPNLWLLFLHEILDYRKKFNQKMSELVHKGLLANQKKLGKEYKIWETENKNPLQAFAEKFNPILEKLNLEVDIVNTEYSIPIANKIKEDIIPIQNTSTGTKGLLLSFLPLFKLETKDSIILIDEPERSLYPDMQIGLMEHYKNIAPNAQFIVATHSPFIAASFEPEERFVLYFDDNGNVQVRQGKSPIGDDPNDLLKNDFGVNYYNKYGIEAYQKYLDLKQKVSNEKNSAKKKELMLEMVKLGNEYNF